LCNDDPSQSQTQTASFQKEEGKKWSFAYSFSFKFGASLSVSAGLPDVAEVNAEFHWEVGVESSYTREEDTTTTRTMDFPVVVPARSRVEATFTWWDSKCDVPYTADLLYTFTDGSQTTFSYADSFSGAFITDALGDYHSVPLQPGESCPHTHLTSIISVKY